MKCLHIILHEGDIVALSPGQKSIIATKKSVLAAVTWLVLEWTRSRPHARAPEEGERRIWQKRAGLPQGERSGVCSEVSVSQRRIFILI